MAFATWIIAFAAVANVFVYWRISQQTKEQITLTKEQIDLTRKLFLESHKPELSVAIGDCEYSEPDGIFEGRIMLANHGSASGKISDSDGWLSRQEGHWPPHYSTDEQNQTTTRFSDESRLVSKGTNGRQSAWRTDRRLIQRACRRRISVPRAPRIRLKAQLLHAVLGQVVASASKARVARLEIASARARERVVDQFERERNGNDGKAIVQRSPALAWCGDFPGRRQRSI